MKEEKELSLIEILKNEKEEEEKAQFLLVSKLYNQARGVGAPTKYRPEFIKVLLMHVGVKGKSYKSLAFQLGIASEKTLYNWESQHIEWKNAKKIAEAGRLNYIENLLCGLADGSLKGNAAAAIFYAKNAAPTEFQDNRNLTISGGVTYVIDTGIPAKQLPDIIIQESIAFQQTKEIEEEEERDEDLL